MTEANKTCTKCHEEKPVGAFSFRTRALGALQPHCKVCCAQYFKIYAANNAEKLRAYESTPQKRRARADQQRRQKINHPERVFAKKRRAHLKAFFGFTEADYEALLNTQNGVCAICQTTDPGRGGKHFHIDHCHDTGRVRGLLCNRCNVGLGHFKDDAAMLQVAVAYLQETK